MGHVRPTAVAAALILGLATLAAALWGFGHDRDADATGQRDASRTAAGVLRSALAGTADSTQSVAGLYGASQNVTDAEFDRFARPLLRRSAANTVGWIKHVDGPDRAAFQRRSGHPFTQLAPDGRLVPVPPRASYDVVSTSVTQHPMRDARGLNVTSDPKRRRVIAAARRANAVRSTPVITLAGSLRPGVVSYAPVYDGDSGRVLGYAFGAFELAPVIAAVENSIPRAAALTIAQEGRVRAKRGHLDDATKRTVVVAGQRWRLALSTGDSDFGFGPAALLIGGLLTVLGTGALTVLAGRTRRAQTLAAARTAERDDAESAREMWEGRFARAFEEAPGGMALVTGSGHFVRANASLAETSGYPIEVLETMTVAALVHPDELAATRKTLGKLAQGTSRGLAGEYRLIHAEGHAVWVALHVTAMDGAAAGQPLVLAQVTDITEKRRFEDQLKHLADHDPLTALLNRRSFERELGRQVSYVKRYGPGGALLVLDLDEFKSVNDTLGHGAGDRLIVSVAEVLSTTVRDTDTVARLGGDEFAILVPNVDVDGARAVGEKVVAAVREQARATVGDDPRCPVTVSVGITMFERDLVSGEQALSEADQAMYEAKGSGRDTFVVHHVGGSTTHVPARS